MNKKQRHHVYLPFNHICVYLLELEWRPKVGCPCNRNILCQNKHVAMFLCMQQGILRVKLSYPTISCPFFKRPIMDISCSRDLLVISACLMHFVCETFLYPYIMKKQSSDLFSSFLRISISLSDRLEFKKEWDILLLFYLIQMNQLRSIIRRKHALRSSLNGGWTWPFTSLLLYSKEKFACRSVVTK